MVSPISFPPTRFTSPTQRTSQARFGHWVTAKDKLALLEAERSLVAALGKSAVLCPPSAERIKQLRENGKRVDLPSEPVFPIRADQLLIMTTVDGKDYADDKPQGVLIVSYREGLTRAQVKEKLQAVPDMQVKASLTDEDGEFTYKSFVVRITTSVSKAG